MSKSMPDDKGRPTNTLRLGRLQTLVALAIILAWLPGCVTSPIYTLPRPKPEQTSCIHPPKFGGTLVGVAISGGGSRAALFGSAGLEGLAKVQVGTPAHSLLEDVSMISSVSGGSMATSYFAARKPPREVPVLASDGKLSADYQTFFAEYEDVMNRDYEDPLLFRNISRLRWFNPAWTARSLTEYLNEQFLNGMSFKDVRERELRGDIPRLLINTTLYNNGHRLVITTLPHEKTQYDLLSDLNRPVGSGNRPKAVEAQFRAKWESLQSTTPEKLDVDLCYINLGSAVATSMSFPPIIGPITFKVEGEENYWHAGDGGLSDNMGIESLFLTVMKHLQENSASRALIIAFDSSFPFEVGSERLDHFAEGFTLFNYDYSRIPGIMEERALAYRVIFSRIMVEQGVWPDERRLKFIQLRHIDAAWKEDMSDLPESCKKEDVKLTSPPMVTKRLASIVTRLWIKSDCDRDLVTVAAAKLVEGKKEEIQAFLQQSRP